MLLRLIKKNAFYFLIYILPIYSLLCLYWIISRHAIDTVFAISHGQWMFIMIIGAISVSEQNEEKTRGYAFLSLLPVRTWDVVFSKFVLVFLSVLFVVSLNLILASFFNPTPFQNDLIAIYYVGVGNICLLIAGGLYNIIYKFGYRIFLIIILPSIILLFLFPIFAIEFLIPRLPSDFQTSLRAIASMKWPLLASVSIVCILLFGLLFKTAVLIKSRKD